MIKTGETLTNFLWQHVDGMPIQNNWQSVKDIPATTPLSDSISKALKKQGFTFFGSTICYAFMQATGMVNDHLIGCHCHKACKAMAKNLF